MPSDKFEITIHDVEPIMIQKLSPDAHFGGETDVAYDEIFNKK